MASSPGLRIGIGYELVYDLAAAHPYRIANTTELQASLNLPCLRR